MSNLDCIMSICNVSITYFTGDNYIRIWRNTYLVSMLKGNLLIKTVTVVGVSYWCEFMYSHVD